MLSFCSPALDFIKQHHLSFALSLPYSRKGYGSTFRDPAHPSPFFIPCPRSSRRTMSVRKSPPPAGSGFALTKRARVASEEADDGNTMTMTVASSGEGQRKNALVRTITRTSGLEAPIVSLAGAHGVSFTSPDALPAKSPLDTGRSTDS